jgi:uncharacterized membrane protein
MALLNRNLMDKDAEEVIGNLLQTGVILAATVVLFGGILYLVRHGSAPTHYRTFAGEPEELRHIPSILREIVTLRASAIIQFGLLILIATPVARVAFSVWAFAKERDWTYVVFTLIVLSLLIYSLTGHHF